MTKDQIEQRLTELETAKGEMESQARELRLIQATKQAELNEVQRQITAATWENSDLHSEFQELRTALAVLNR